MNVVKVVVEMADIIKKLEAKQEKTIDTEVLEEAELISQEVNSESISQDKRGVQEIHERTQG
jgi:hypothetical protein